jgi:hypothetical protein
VHSTTHCVDVARDIQSVARHIHATHMVRDSIESILYISLQCCFLTGCLTGKMRRCFLTLPNVVELHLWSETTCVHLLLHVVIRDNPQLHRNLIMLPAVVPRRQACSMATPDSCETSTVRLTTLREMRRLKTHGDFSRKLLLDLLLWLIGLPSAKYSENLAVKAIWQYPRFAVRSTTSATRIIRD